jgi:hypothetical protein
MSHYSKTLRFACFAFMAGILLLQTAARAQDVTPFPTAASNAVSLSGGLDSALVAQLDYTRKWTLDSWSAPILLKARVQAPVFGFDLNDSLLGVGVRSALFEWGGWKLQLGLEPHLRNAQNPLFTAHTLGLALLVAPGYQSETWGVQLELGYERALWTHLRHSAQYRTLVYTDAKDGWYSGSAGTFRGGFGAGLRLGSFELSTHAGAVSNFGVMPLSLPFYATLGVGYAF